FAPVTTPSMSSPSLTGEAGTSSGCVGHPATASSTAAALRNALLKYMLAPPWNGAIVAKKRDVGVDERPTYETATVCVCLAKEQSGSPIEGVCYRASGDPRLFSRRAIFRADHKVKSRPKAAFHRAVSAQSRRDWRR